MKNAEANIGREYEERTRPKKFKRQYIESCRQERKGFKKLRKMARNIEDYRQSMNEVLVPI